MKDSRDEELYASVVAQVVARRVELGLSQRELAELCGTTQSAVARFESARRPPKLDTLAAIAEALDCTLEVTFRPRTRPTRTRRTP